MQDKITIANAPECLNTNDQAMWVLGYQAAIEARSSCLLQIQEPPTKTEALAHYSQQAILAMDEAAPAAEAVPDGGTPGLWRVRKREKDGQVLGCFVTAPDCQGRAYDADILGDDYDSMERKLADCELIVTAVNAYRAALAATPAADPPMVDMTPPATSRDRWMYEQGRLAERDARTPGSVAAAAPVVLPEPATWTLQSELDAKRTTTNGHLWFSNPVNALWTALYTEQQMRALLAGVSAPAAQAVGIPDFDSPEPRH